MDTEVKLEVKRKAGRGASFNVQRVSSSKLASLVNQMNDKEEGGTDKVKGKKKSSTMRGVTPEAKYERLKVQFDEVAQELVETKLALQNYQNHNLAI